MFDFFYTRVQPQLSTKLFVMITFTAPYTGFCKLLLR